MYTSGSTEFNQIIETPNNQSVKKRLVLLDNGTIIDKIKSLSLYSSSSSQELQLGTTNMSYIDAEVESDLLLTNREVRLECGVELSDGSEEYIPMGVFTIQKPQGDIDFVKFKAHDNMQKFEKVYSSALDYPTTSDLVLDEICNMCGVMLSTPIENPIEITVKLQGYTCREVLGFIAGIHGKFACIDRLGTLNLCWYSETPIDKQIGLIWAFNKSDDDFTVDKIEIAKDTETNYTSGSGFSAIYHSNPLATQEITDDLFAKLDGFTYNASTIDMLDDIRLDVWDIVKVTYLDGKEYLIPCMSLKQDFGQGSTSIQSYAKSDTENEYRYTGSTTNYINRVAMELLLTNRIVATKVDAEYVNSHAITTENFEAKVAEIKDLVVEEIDGKYATIDFANIDIAHINKTNIGLLFAEVGLLDRATIVDGHVTGFLDAVEINANKITAGTLIADRILLSGGKNGVLYALNNLGELTSTNVDTLDGYILTDRTITADKIIAKSITSNEIDVAELFANQAAIGTLIAQDAFIDAIETNRIVVGASNKADEAIEKVNKTVKSITMHYLATTASSGVTTSTSGWTTTVQQIDATKKYLWTYQTMTYADNTTTDTSPVISGVYGNEGVDGQPGENGVGITSVTPLYYLKSNTTAPSAPTSAVTSTSTGSGVWTTAIPKYVSGYTYFTCTQTKYTDNTYSWSTVVADNSLTDAYASLGNKANRDEIVAENLLEFPYFEKNHTQSNIEWTVFDDGTVKANGTASAFSQFYFNLDTSLDLKPNTTYTLSGCPSGGATSTYRIRIVINYQKDGQVQYSDIGNGVTFTTPSNYVDCRIMIDVNSGVTVNNLIFKPMLEKGSVAHAYQPYVMSRQGLVEQILAENLLIYPYVDTTRTNAGITFTDLGNGQIRAKGTQTASTNFRCRSRDANVDKNQLILPKGTYTISGCPSGGSLTTYYLQAGYTGDNGSWASLGNDYGDGVTFTLTKDTAIQLLIIIDDNCPTIDVTFKPMLEVGTVAHPYREYSKGGTGIANNLYYPGTTEIHGGKIYTDSIKAKSLDITEIFADSAFIDALRTNSIIVGLTDEIASKTPLIQGTHTTATQTWTGVAPFSELKDGQTIMYGLPNRGSSGNSTLTLTLADGSTTSALPIYYQANSRVTTQYAAGALITMTYRENVKIGSATYTGWWTTVDSNTYDRIRYSTVIKAQSAITGGNLIVGTSSGYKHLKLGTAFDISYPILYAGSAISSGATGNNNYLSLPMPITTTQSISMIAYKPVYIKGKLSGTTFTPDGTTPIRQTIPTTEDGYQYILLGTANSSTQFFLLADNPIYQFIEGKFQQIGSGANANAESIKNNIYHEGTTLIDGGKIFTDTLFSKDIEITGTFVATGNTWLKPGLEEMMLVRSYINNEVTLSANQLETLDFNVDNKVNLTDFLAIKSMMLGRKTIDDYPNYQKVTSEVTVTINPSNAEKIIHVTGTNSYEREIDIYFGTDGISVPSVQTNGLRCVTIATEDDIECLGDVYANYGLDTQVSLLGLQDRMNYLVPHPYSLIKDADLTTSQSIYSTVEGRKFSDYGTLIISMGAGTTDVRATLTIPRTIFDGTDNFNRTFYLDCWSNNGQTFNQIAVAFYSDTQIKAWLATSTTVCKRLNIYGIKTDASLAGKGGTTL